MVALFIVAFVYFAGLSCSVNFVGQALRQSKTERRGHDSPAFLERCDSREEKALLEQVILSQHLKLR